MTTNTRTVRENSDSGLWDVLDHAGAWLAEFESESNAREFAAASELLDALVAIAARLAGDFDHPSLKHFGPLSVGRLEDADRIARAAIAKATGAEA